MTLSLSLSLGAIIATNPYGSIKRASLPLLLFRLLFLLYLISTISIRDFPTFTMASINHTTVPPPWTLSPPAFYSYARSPFLPWLSDFHLSLLLPIAAYWLMSLIFHIITSQNLFPQYRLNTPQEFKKRNRVTVGEVLRSVILQQVVQTTLGLLIGHIFDAGDFCGRETYDVLSWAARIRKSVKQGTQRRQMGIGDF